MPSFRDTNEAALPRKAINLAHPRINPNLSFHQSLELLKETAVRALLAEPAASSPPPVTGWRARPPPFQNPRSASTLAAPASSHINAIGLSSESPPVQAEPQGFSRQESATCNASSGSAAFNSKPAASPGSSAVGLRGSQLPGPPFNGSQLHGPLGGLVSRGQARQELHSALQRETLATEGRRTNEQRSHLNGDIKDAAVSGGSQGWADGGRDESNVQSARQRTPAVSSPTGRFDEKPEFMPAPPSSGGEFEVVCEQLFADVSLLLSQSEAPAEVKGRVERNMGTVWRGLQQLQEEVRSLKQGRESEREKAEIGDTADFALAAVGEAQSGIPESKNEAQQRKNKKSDTAVRLPAISFEAAVARLLWLTRAAVANSEGIDPKLLLDANGSSRGLAGRRSGTTDNRQGLWTNPNPKPMVERNPNPNPSPAGSTGTTAAGCRSGAGLVDAGGERKPPAAAEGMAGSRQERERPSFPVDSAGSRGRSERPVSATEDTAAGRRQRELTAIAGDAASSVRKREQLVTAGSSQERQQALRAVSELWRERWEEAPLPSGGPDYRPTAKKEALYAAELQRLAGAGQGGAAFLFGVVEGMGDDEAAEKLREEAGSVGAEEMSTCLRLLHLVGRHALVERVLSGFGDEDAAQDEDK